ncbi:GlsB/YeaQ/YmgE family stress response membrane protein [Gimibacter soli]|uniref:GlsB/YeaQ/YmgE family stress response membrane protein n=1 Tax=Gimibacter soli TaxID=3024400 RepID=A0AAE9XVX2_9PROT|nr:GlsB/YeaQ/YmgE family stress response membrane protein [Gimibacter soli]WCL55068.1 GlsB/YeaQ/YmgE family stress response membrane protein [Gimibacter soli]
MLYALLLGGLAGFLAGQFMKGAGYGIIVNIILGLLGGLVGRFLFSLIGFGASGFIGELITATVGAVVLIWLSSKIKAKG